MTYSSNVPPTLPAAPRNFSHIRIHHKAISIIKAQAARSQVPLAGRLGFSQDHRRERAAAIKRHRMESGASKRRHSQTREASRTRNARRNEAAPTDPSQIQAYTSKLKCFNIFERIHKPILPFAETTLHPRLTRTKMNPPTPQQQLLDDKTPEPVSTHRQRLPTTSRSVTLKRGTL